MNLPKIFNPGVYRHRQVGHHMVVPHFWISLNVSGLVRSINYDMDGNLLSSYEHTADSRPHQLLSIGVPGFWSDFEYDSTRENWVIFLEWNALSYDKKNRKILLDYDGVQLELPLSIPLQPSETESLRNQFNTIREYHNSGIPGNQLSAHAGDDDFLGGKRLQTGQTVGTHRFDFSRTAVFPDVFVRPLQRPFIDIGGGSPFTEAVFNQPDRQIGVVCTHVSGRPAGTHKFSHSGQSF